MVFPFCGFWPGTPIYLYYFGLTECSLPTRPNQPVAYRAYAKDELLCPVKCIYVYLAQRSEIVTQDFTEVFLTFGKPHHLASKDSLAWCMKEVKENSGMDIEILKAHSNRVASGMQRIN